MQSQGSLVLLLLVLGVSAYAQADLLNCEDKVPGISELTDKLTEMTGIESSAEQGVGGFFKNVGCQIKKGAKKLGEKAKDLGVELKEGAQKLGEKAKDLGSDLKERFDDFRDKLSKDSVEDRGFLANVEIINPDILKGEQQCGHGHILDALGNCSKLRK